MPVEQTTDPALARYARQMLLEPFGHAGQKRLSLSQAVLVGCGALGSVLADSLTRAGVGHLRILDRDFIELNNLQRQVLFDEHDLAANLPKAEAAARKLRRINSAVSIEPRVVDVHAGNIESLCGDADLILDGTDNFETRFLINDLAVKLELPWVYGACIGCEGLVMAVLPGQTPCLRCIWEDAPSPGMSPTCDTAGVLGPLVNIVASLQAVEAMKLLSGNAAAINRSLVSIDAWSGRFRSLDMSAARAAGGCVCCGKREFEFLRGDRTMSTATLCGRDAVQISPQLPADFRLNLRDLAGRMKAGKPVVNEFLVRFAADGLTLTVFPDGRAIVQGTSDPAIARSAYAKYVGG